MWTCSALKMEAVYFSETLVSTYKFTPRKTNTDILITYLPISRECTISIENSPINESDFDLKKKDKILRKWLVYFLAFMLNDRRFRIKFLLRKTFPRCGIDFTHR
jgi:hypothetical protein